jgi:hypothetical protein
LECLRSELSIVQRLIVVLGSHLQKSLTHHPPVLTFVSSPSFKTTLAFQWFLWILPCWRSIGWHINFPL